MIDISMWMSYTFFDYCAITEFTADPLPVEDFGDSVGCTTPSKGIKNSISFIRTHRDYSIQQLYREFIILAVFAVLMSYWINICPNIRYIYTKWVHFPLVSAIILYFSSAMSASLKRNTLIIKRCGFCSLNKRDQSVVRRIQSVLNWKAKFHVYCYPCPECQHLG